MTLFLCQTAIDIHMNIICPKELSTGVFLNFWRNIIEQLISQITYAFRCLFLLTPLLSIRNVLCELGAFCNISAVL